MIFAGNCLYVDESDSDSVYDTAQSLLDFALETNIETLFRCKLFGGGTSPNKYQAGIGSKGIRTLREINEFIPTGTEVHNLNHIGHAILSGLDYIWVGARNCQNYSLLEDLKAFEGMILIKRSPGMTIDELIGLYDICKDIHKLNDVYMVERGINTFDRLDWSRWSPDLKGVIRLKHQRPEIFERLVVDCSHSVGEKLFIDDTYKAFKAIGVEHFMFECTIDGKSKTDSNHMLSVDELKEILI